MVLVSLLSATLEILRVLLIRGLWKRIHSPQIRGQELVGVGKSIERSSDEVTLSLGVTSGTGVNVLDTSEGDHLLGSWGTDNVGTSWGWDQSNSDGTALTGDLHWDSVWLTELVTPVASSDWNQRKLGSNDSTLDSMGNFLGTLDTETNVSILITEGNESLETSSLTGRRLLLDGHDLHDLILESSRGKEMIDDLVFLDWKTMEVHLLERLDLAIGNQATEFSNWDPSLAFITSASLTLTAALSTLAALTLTLSESLSETTLSLLDFSHYGLTNILEAIDKVVKETRDKKFLKVMPESVINGTLKHQAQRELALKKKKAERRKLRRQERKDQPENHGKHAIGEPSLDDEYEIEYIPDVVSEEYADLLQKFVPVVPVDRDSETTAGARDEYSEAMASILNADAQRKAAEAAAASIIEMSTAGTVSKKQQRLSSRISVAALKAAVDRPDMVDSMDNCSPDPLFLLFCKAYKNAVQVPRHWSNKRRYMSAKRGVDKVPFKLPEYIEQTGIAKIRQAVLAKEAERDIKAKQRAKMRPKTGKLDIDYQVLHNAFFKYQTKPSHLTKMGDIYYEGREAETRYVHKKPGRISPALREALGMIEGSPPPWLINMQRFGPPPAYPNLKIPGLNAPIPYGAEWGYTPGAWGRAPVDEFGNPIYGGLWNPERDRAAIVDLETIQPGRGLWGEFVEEDSEDEDEEDVVKPVVIPAAVPVKPAAPVQPPQAAPPQFSSGVAVALAELYGPQKVQAEPQRETPGELYKVLAQKSAPAETGALFPSRTIYEITPSPDVTGGIATQTGIAQRAIEVEGSDVISTDVIKKQLAEHEAAAEKTVEAKKPAKKKAKFKF